MTNEEVGTLLQRFPLRGLIFFRVLSVGSTIGFGVLFILDLVAFAVDRWVPVSWGWTFSSFVLAIISGLASFRARSQFDMSWLIAHDPTIVYWAHAAGSQGPDLQGSVDNCKCLTLHLRIGRQLDVQLAVPKMRELNAWLREKNPDIRWGHYDPPSSL